MLMDLSFCGGGLDDGGVILTGEDCTGGGGAETTRDFGSKSSLEDILFLYGTVCRGGGVGAVGLGSRLTGDGVFILVTLTEAMTFPLEIRFKFNG